MIQYTPRICGITNAKLQESRFAAGMDAHRFESTVGLVLSIRCAATRQSHAALPRILAIQLQPPLRNRFKLKVVDAATAARNTKSQAFLRRRIHDRTHRVRKYSRILRLDYISGNPIYRDVSVTTHSCDNARQTH